MAQQQQGKVVVSFGYPLDQLLNKRVQRDGESREHSSGNIVIAGHAGTGKTTLALQIAVAIASAELNREPRYASAFVSLEHPFDHIERKAAAFGWKDSIKSVQCLHDLGDYPEEGELAEHMRRILCADEGCPARQNKEQMEPGHTCVRKTPHYRVLIPSFSPRSVSRPDSERDDLFRQRFRQLELLVEGAKHFRDRKNKGEMCSDCPDLRLVCIDSLNVFGNRVLTREELLQVFDLFTQNQIVGVLVVEEYAGPTSEGGRSIDFETVEYLADVVIRLTTHREHGHYSRYFQIMKSRYQGSVTKPVPFRIVPMASSGKVFDNEKKAWSSGVMVSPSADIVISGVKEAQRRVPSETGGTPRNAKERPSKEPFTVGMIDVEQLLLPKTLRAGNVLMLEGPMNTFKSNIATSFLLRGVLKSEKALFLRLGRFHYARGSAISRELRVEMNSRGVEECSGLKDEGRDLLCEWRRWEFKKCEGTLTEVIFPNQPLLPEEFLDRVHWFLKEGDIRRVVIDDIEMIGTKHPFLASSFSFEDQFLAQFVQLIRASGASLLIVGSTGQELADAWAERAKMLSDATLSCEFRDVFGERRIVMTGQGMIAGEDRPLASQYETVPGVVTREERNNVAWLNADFQYLRGLVGFESGNVIHRPGLSLHVFGDGAIHSRYREKLATMLRTAYARPVYDRDADALRLHDGGVSTPNAVAGAQLRGQLARTSADVDVVPFSSSSTDPIHKSLEVLKGTPIDRTAVVTVDDFWDATNRDEGDEGQTPRGSRLVNIIEHVEGHVAQRLLDAEKHSPGGFDTLISEPFVHEFAALFSKPPGTLVSREWVADCPRISETTVTREFAEFFLSAIHADTAMDSVDLAPTESTKAAAKITGELEGWKSSAQEVQQEALKARQATGAIVRNECRELEYVAHRVPEEGLWSVLRRCEGGQEGIRRLALHIFQRNHIGARGYYQRKRKEGRIDWSTITERTLPIFYGYPLNSNVLLLACDRGLTNWGTEGPRSWRQVRDHLNSSKASFDCLHVPETYTCALMDALAPSLECKTHRRAEDVFESYERDFDRGMDIRQSLVGVVSGEKVREVEAFGELLNGRPCRDSVEAEARRMFDEDSEIRLCWYSELRQMLEDDTERRDWRIHALPNGGFRGDWFLGIVSGSVSVNFGLEVIDSICNKTEEFDRYERGVGLPTRLEFYTESFPAWPGAEKVTLRDVYGIYETAASRSFIDDYRRFRTVLYATAKRLAAGHGPNSPLDETEVGHLLHDMSTQIRVLTSEE